MIWKAVKATGKIVIFMAASLLVSFALTIPWIAITGFSELSDFASPLLLVEVTLPLVAAIMTAGAMLWLFDRRDLGYIGLRGERVASDLSVGLAFGAATLFVGLLAAWIVGVAQLRSTSPNYSPLNLSVSLATALVAAAGEEVICRGYILFELLSKFSTRTAILVSSLLVAALHAPALLQDVMGIVGFVGLMLAGVQLALAVLKTGTLWLAIGIHAGWNFALGPIVGWVVSGFVVNYDTRLFELQGPIFMTGGSFGFEASVPGLLGTLLGIAILLPLPDKVQSAMPLAR